MKTKIASKTGVRLLTTAFIAIFALQLIIAPASAGVPSKTNIKVCLILPTTGGLGTIGVDEIRGADIAVSQANKVLATGTSGVTFSDANRADSATDPATADTGFKNLVDTQGCQITVGAAGSGETNGFLPDAKTRGVPTISPSSTAASLHGAYPGILFRTPGPDTIQTVASAKWLYSHGIRNVAIITRNDAYGTNFRDGFKTAFLGLGGTAVADPTVTTYDYTSSSDIVAKTDTLNTQISTFLGSNAASTVGVLVIAFATDGTTLFDHARTTTKLPLVTWFGTDGIAGDRAFVPPSSGGTASTAVSTFLNSVNLTASNPTAPNPGPGGASMANLAYNGTMVPKNGGGNIDLTGTGYFSIYGITPQPYWDYSYDAAVLAMLAIAKANSYVGANIAAALPAEANLTIGATGLDSLGPSGDRAVQHYIFYGYTHKSVNGTCCFNWYANASFSHFYNGDSSTLQTTRPTGSETGGTIWTTNLQTLASTITVSSAPVFPNPIIALTSVLLVSTTILLAARRKRL